MFHTLAQFEISLRLEQAKTIPLFNFSFYPLLPAAHVGTDPLWRSILLDLPLLLSSSLD